MNRSSSFTLLSYPGPPLPPGVTPRSSGLSDVTGQVSVTRSRPRRMRGGWQQTLTLNDGGPVLAGPLALVFDRLGQGTRLRHAAGRTRLHRPLNSPYLNIPLGADDLFSPGQPITLTVQFTDNKPRYTLRLLVGNGVV